tara:strand:+ start:7757 stop:8089 length:333 start_codon:yes stop_codon:yes gene_type:complete
MNKRNLRKYFAATCILFLAITGSSQAAASIDYVNVKNTDTEAHYQIQQHASAEDGKCHSYKVEGLAGYKVSGFSKQDKHVYFGGAANDLHFVNCSSNTNKTLATVSYQKL